MDKKGRRDKERYSHYGKIFYMRIGKLISSDYALLLVFTEKKIVVENVMNEIVHEHAG